MDFINQKNLLHSLKAVCAIINEIQKNRIFIKKNYCELFLTKHNLMDSTGFVYKKNKKISTREISNILAYADKNNDSTELSKICKISLKKFNDISKDLIKLNMIQIL